MNKQKILLGFGVFVALSTLFILFVLPSASDVTLEKTTSGQSIFNKNGRFVKMADTIHKYLDTSFYAEYRAKPHSYFFNYLLREGNGNPFTVSEFIVTHVFAMPQSIGVKYIWRNPNDNFISFQIYNDNNERKHIMVLDAGQDTIKGLTIGYVPTDSFLRRQEMQIGRNKSITREDNRVYIVSSSEYTIIR